MAGEWIPWDIGLAEKPKVQAIARLLTIDRFSAAARLMVVWEWANMNLTDGNARSVTKTFIDERAGVTGMADAMVRVGWLVELPDGLHFPDFDTHNSQSAKTRLLTAQRVSALRKRNAPSVTNVTMPALQNALPEKRREEKRREEDIRSDPVSGSSLINNTQRSSDGGTGGDFSIKKTGTGSGRKERSFSQVFILRIAEAFRWTATTAMQQKKSLAAVARQLAREPDREDLANVFVELAVEKAADPGLDKPVAAWQSEVTRKLNGRAKGRIAK